MEEVRIDKYIWSIRLFKTRTLSTKKCNAGKVKIDGQSVKPAQNISVGDVFTVRKNHQLRTIKVLKLIEKRVGYDIAKDCYEDITPEEDKLDVNRSAFYTSERRDRGSGRPTKKERREIEEFKRNKYDDWEEW